MSSTLCLDEFKNKVAKIMCEITDLTRSDQKIAIDFIGKCLKNIKASIKRSKRGISPIRITSSPKKKSKKSKKSKHTSPKIKIHRDESYEDELKSNNNATETCNLSPIQKNPDKYQNITQNEVQTEINNVIQNENDFASNEENLNDSPEISFNVESEGISYYDTSQRVETPASFSNAYETNELLSKTESDSNAEEFTDETDEELNETYNADSLKHDDHLEDNPIEETIINKRFKCTICSQVLGTYISLMDHLFNHQGSPQSCLNCRKTFNNAISFKFHQNKYCKTTTQIESQDFSHSFKNDHSNKNVAKIIREIIICPYCGQRFSKVFNLRRHMWRRCINNNHSYKDASKNEENDDFVCKSCKLTFDSKEDFKIHKKTHEKHKCLQCEETFSTRKLLRDHCRDANHKQQKSNFKFECAQCQMSFPNRATYRIHMKEFKNVKNHKAIWCNVCMMSFSYHDAFNRHCTRKLHLTNTNSKAADEKAFICEKCGTTFANKDGLTTHERRVHGKLDLSCEYCTYKTTTLSSMNGHKRLNHAENLKKYICDKCTASFINLCSLKKHLSTVHSEVRRFACNICQKEFKLNNQLKRHKLTHNQIKAHPCAHCPMGFQRCTHLVRHMASKHEEHLPKEQLEKVMRYKRRERQRKMQRLESKTLPMEPTIVSDVPVLHDDQEVFSLIDVQSGELVTLSVSEMSKKVFIDMANGGLLSSVHIPDLWNGS